MIKLYRKHANGVGTWRIWQDGELIRIAHATTLDGQEVEHEEHVTVNQSRRSFQEQMDLRITSRVRLQRDRGYSDSLESAQAGNTNQLGLPLPMLAQPLAKANKAPTKDDVLQLKLNGHRCLGTKQDGRVILYSRRGKEIHLPHIAEFLQDRIPEGIFTDGELYHHGTRLQTIGSWIKKAQPESKLLQYICYDLISQDTFKDRYQELSDLLPNWSSKESPVRVLSCLPYIDDVTQARTFEAARKHGFEGLIRRSNDTPYQDGVRSHSLVKIKGCEDCEVTVKAVERSKSGIAVCICETDDGKEVRPTAPGNRAEKQHVLDHPEQYIGKRLTIEYSELTDKGVPFHPVAREWREEI
jgi:ATP-dependent DNA ligase